MEAELLFALLAGVVLLGFLGQWLAWWVRLPSIIFLFAFGLLAGPVTGILHPDQMFGNLLFPTVTALIGIILFEGGLTLEFNEIEKLRGTVFRVIVIGATITFLLSTFFARILLGFPLSLSFLLGAILVVTGPTVVIPLLHQIRPKGAAGSIARWEGIIIDPIGAILAVIVFQLILSTIPSHAEELGIGAWKFFKAISIGTGVGLLFAHTITVLFDRYWVPDYLHNLAILALVLCAQGLSNHFSHEAGLLAVTVMGMYLANQNRISVRRILHFKEELRVVFISLLFIILVARLDRSFIFEIGWGEMGFLLALILLVRPIAILASTAGSQLNWSERGFLSWIAPRGIVAAAVSSLFAAKLQQIGLEGADRLVDMTFLVIAGTVLVYGLTLNPISNWLGLSETDPQGILMVGAHEWARALAQALKEQGVQVKLVDKNESRIRRALGQGLQAERVDVSTESKFQTIGLHGLGYCMALTQNDEVNTLAIVHATDMGFDQSQVFQLSPASKTSEEDEPDPLQGRILFERDLDFHALQSRFESSWNIRTIDVNSPDNQEDLKRRMHDTFLPMVQLRNGSVEIITDEEELDLQRNDILLGLSDGSSNEDSTR